MNSRASNGPGLSPSSSPDADLAQRREEIRRGFVHANTATAVALIISVLLAGTTVYFALQAKHANDRTRQGLWNSERARATALRLSAKVGRRQEGLASITNAASIWNAPELRDEAIATLALTDFQPGSALHPATPRALAYAVSSRLSYYALGSLDGTAEVRAYSNGALVLRTSQDGQRIFQVAFSPDEQWLAVRGNSGAVEVWSIPERRRVFEAQYSQREPATDSLAFHPNNRYLAAACGDNAVRIVDFQSNRVERVVQTEGRPWTVAFDPAGSRLAAGVGRKIEFLAHPSAARVGCFDTPDGVGQIAWHPFGHAVAIGSPNGRLTLLDVCNGRFKTLDGHTQRIIGVAFHPAGQILASASWDGTTRLWDAGSGRPYLQTHAGFALAFNSSGDRLGFFREGIGIGDWQVQLGCGFRTVAVPPGSAEEILAAALSRDGKWLAFTTREAVHLRETQTGRELHTMPLARAWGVAFASEDQAIFLSSDSGLHRVPLQCAAGVGLPGFGKSELLPGAPKGSFAHGSVTFGERRFLGAEGVSEHVFVDLAEPHQVLTLPGRLDNSAPSIHGRLVSSSRWKGHGTRVWSLDTRKAVASLPGEGGVSLFSPDGRLLVVGTSTEFLFYETERWHLTRRLTRDSASAISGLLAFNPAGDVLAVTHTLRQIRLLSPLTGTTLANLYAPSPDRITCLSFSGDGSTLAAGTDHGEVQVWDLAELRRQLESMRLGWTNGGGLTVALSSDTPVFAQEGSHRSAVWFSGACAVLAFVFALYSVGHHRQLVRAYEETEEIATDRRVELERTQGQLLHSQKMKALGTLAAGIAHDFNNLLSIIRMSGQLVRRQVKAAGVTRDNLDAIERAVNQGKNIAGSILGYTRRPGDPNQPYQVHMVVSDTLAMLNAHYLSAIILNLELDVHTPPVRGNRSRLEQILLNFIVNACEAMGGAGTLTLAVRSVSCASGCIQPPRPASCYVELSVRDSGPGISPEVMPRIFEPCFSTKTGAGEHGTGLGLTTVYTIARQDGLGLAVESVTGHGATFRVLVPVDEHSRPSG